MARKTPEPNGNSERTARLILGFMAIFTIFFLMLCMINSFGR